MRSRRLAYLVLAILMSGGCMLRHHMVLEYKDVQFFQCTEIQTRAPTIIKVSGLAFSSALVVDRITTQQEGSSITILVYLAPTREGTSASGSFVYELTVPDSVQEVRFGNSGVVIWRRTPLNSILVDKIGLVALLVGYARRLSPVGAQHAAPSAPHLFPEGYAGQFVLDLPALLFIAGRD